MPISHPIRRLTAWLALWLMVVGAVLPLSAQAVAALSPHSDAIEICTATGMVRLVDAGDATGLGDLDVTQHCPVCTWHGGLAGWPPGPGWGGLRVADVERPVAVTPRPVVADAWQPAVARAPPRV